MSLINRISCTALLVGGMAMPTLHAQDGSRFGVQLQANFPTGDLKTYTDNKAGFGVGLHGAIDLTNGHTLRPRIDYGVYPDVDVNSNGNGSSGSGSFSYKNKLSYADVMVDYLFHPLQQMKGFYVLGGAGAIRWMPKQTLNGIETSQNTTKLNLNAGVGWQFNQTFGVEGRYAWSSIDKNFEANTADVAVTFRF